MDPNQEIDSKQRLRLLAVVIIDVLLIWFGIKFLLADNNFTDTQLFLFGCGATIWGVFMATSSIPNNLTFSAVLVLVGFYFFARAGGVIEASWLLRIFGIASIASAVLLLYITIPRKPNSNP